MAEKKKNEETLEAAEKVAKAVKEKKQRASKPKGDKPNIFVRMGKAIAKFFKNFRGETKKIVWPDAKTVFKNAGIVLIVIIVIGAFIWLIDFALSKSINKLSDVADSIGVTEQADDADTADAEGVELEEDAADTDEAAVEEDAADTSEAAGTSEAADTSEAAGTSETADTSEAA